jgi:hypothetical protein
MNVVSAINRDAMQRAKSLLAQTCVHNANVTDDRDERAHMADVAVLAGAEVSIHLGHDSTAIDACGKVAR